MCKKIGMAIVILSAGLFLWGCGEGGKQKETEMGTQIQLQKDGSIVAEIAAEFPEDLYSADELKDMILTEAASFNQSNPESSISVERLEGKDGMIDVVMKYSSAEAYTAYNADAYNGKELFFGKIKDAYDAGISLDVTLRHVKKEQTISKDELMQMGDTYILILREPAEVKTHTNITYVSAQVDVTGKKTANLSAPEEGGEQERYYIVF